MLQNTIQIYADIASLSGDSLTRSEAEQWCHSRDVSASEGLRIWKAANNSAASAQAIWEDESWWADAKPSKLTWNLVHVAAPYSDYETSIPDANGFGVLLLLTLDDELSRAWISVVVDDKNGDRFGEGDVPVQWDAAVAMTGHRILSAPF